MYLNGASSFHNILLARDATQSAVLLRQVVCPSVCPPVRDVEVLWSNGLGFFENNFTADQHWVFTLSRLQYHGSSSKTLRNFGRNRRLDMKKWHLAHKSCNTSSTGKTGPRLLVKINRKSHTRFDRCQNQRPWMTLKGHYALCFRTRASFGAHHENLNLNENRR